MPKAIAKAPSRRCAPACNASRISPPAGSIWPSCSASKAAANARKLGFAEEARNALAGLARAVVINLIALPIALLLLVTGVGTALLFWVVNAWLLGRELQDMVWLRHRPDKDAAPPLGALTRFALGGIVAGMLLVPFLNLLAPVLSAAAATHLVHGRKVRA